MLIVMDDVVDVKRLYVIKKRIAECVLDSVAKGFITFEDAHEVADYLTDQMDFIHTQEELEDLYEELMLDWNIDTSSLMQKRELEKKEESAQKIDTKEIEQIKNKLSLLAT